VVLGWLRKTTGGVHVHGAGVVLPELAPGRRIYAIGDVHGRLDLLERLQAMIVAHIEASPPAEMQLIYVGDYVDRGPAGAGVIERLARPQPALPPATCLRGNHEEILLRFMVDPSIAQAWQPLGGFETLRSYGVPTRLVAERRFDEARAELWARMPAHHVAFLQHLGTSHRCGPYFFAHAGVRPGVPLEHQSERDLAWIRDEFLSSPRDHGAVVVHGHTPVETPEIRANRINIDTGAYATGRLTCAVIESRQVQWLAT
jgi:serine/threonine protein phosphatase 1